MRLSQSTVISASPREVWDYLEDVENWPRFLAGITRWERAGERRSGLGARYRILMRVGAADVGGLIEIVEWNECHELAWVSVTGVDHRGRLRIRRLRDGRTRVEFRFAYGVAGSGIAGLVAERLAAPQISGHLRRSLNQLKRQVEDRRLRAEAAERRRRRAGARA